ncbi:MAG: V-type ATPase subunit [Candidatus Hadarchaeales archaeon]
MIEVPVLILALTGALFVVFLLLTRRSMPYVFCNATLSAWEGRLIPESRLMELAEAQSPDAVLSALEETDYGKQVAELRKSGLNDPIHLEMALRENANEKYRELLRMLPEGRMETVRMVLSRIDVWNLKAIISMILSGFPVERRKEELIPSPTTPADRLEILASAKNMEELMEYLKGSRYHKAISGAMEEYEKRGLRALLLALDRQYWSSLWHDVVGRRDQRKVLKMMIGQEIDCINVKTILRLKQERAAPEDIERHLIRPSFELNEEMLRAMVMSDDLSSAINMIHITEVGRVLLESSGEIAAGGATAAEAALDRWIVHKFRWLGMTRFFTVAPAISYIVQKENEIKMLRAIYRLKFDGFDPASVKNFLEGVKVEV